MAKAADFASNPAKGYAAKYSPEQVWEEDPGPQVGLDRPPRHPTRSPYHAWLYGVARKDLPPGTWLITDGPEEPELIIR